MVKEQSLNAPDNRQLIGDQTSSLIEAKVKRNYFEHEDSESGEQLLRPLIYAVTADISQDAIERI
jgi:hypothetical protein